FFTNWDSPNHLYKNKGNWQFEKINSAGISNLKSKTEGSCWGDFDNDGWIDLVVSNDGKNYLYRSLSGEHFEPMSLIGYTDTDNNSNALIFFDSNRSGFLDLYVANGGNQKNQFFENHGNENGWVEIHLKGRKSNSSAIGSKVRVFTGGLKQTKEVSAQSGGGCGSQIPLTLHFGLGQHDKIDSIRVSWTSGRIQSLYNIDSKQLIEILEID
ncbi:MAG: CRTAC1 family protein, partial [Crocinitomicaceae bacterium]|nr:CRTAC1 family protein [Crocinitomicaceae bacterium]